MSLTFRELKEKLNQLSEEQLDCHVVISDMVEDKVFAADSDISLEAAEEENDRLKRPFFAIKK